MNIKKQTTAAILSFVLIAGVAIGQSLLVPKVQRVNTDDLIQVIPHGIPTAQSFFATADQITAAGGLTIGSPIYGGCTNGYVLFNNAGFLGCEVGGGGSGNIVIGTTTITGTCPSGQLVYNNSGVAGCKSGSGSFNETSPYLITGSTQTNSLVARGDYSVVNAWDFGIITANTNYDAGEATANVAAIRGAVNYALSVGAQVVQLPCQKVFNSNIWLNDTLYVDKAANHTSVTGAANNGAGLIRLTVTSTAGWSTGNIVAVYGVGGTVEANSSFEVATGVNWTITVINGTHVDLQGSTFANAYTSGGTVYNAQNFGFSLMLRGCGGQGNINGQGTALFWPPGFNAPYIVIGPGSGMALEGLNAASQQDYVCPAAMGKQRVGVAYAAGNGGGSRFDATNVGVFNAYIQFLIGFANNSLADRTTFNRVYTVGGQYGVKVNESQAFMLDLHDSAINAFYGVYNPQNTTVNINGGGWQYSGDKSGALAVTSISALSDTGDGSYAITMNVTAPDANLLAGCYNNFALKSANFGPVPFTLTSFNSGTSGITLRMLDSWRAAHFGEVNVITNTDMSAELQAQTFLFGVEKATQFYGSVNANGVHIEGQTPFTLFAASAAQLSSTLTHIRLNGDPACSQASFRIGQNSATEGAYYVCQTFPLLSLGNTAFTLTDFFPSLTAYGDGYIIDSRNQSGVDYTFTRIAGAAPTSMPSPILRWSANTGSNPVNDANRFAGDGWWDRSPWIVRNQTLNSGNDNTKTYQFTTDTRTGFKGFRPNPDRTPRLSPAQYATVSGALGAGDLGTYPLIHGATLYQIATEGVVSPVPKFATSAHQFWSWGQNLTGAWSYKGGSEWVSLGVAVSGAANNGAGLVRLTVSSTATFTTGQKLVVTGVVGTTEANYTPGNYATITVIDGTHIDLQGSTFVNAYISGGLVSDVSMMFAGLGVILNFDAADHVFVVTGVFPGLGGITVTTPANVLTGTFVINPGTKTTVYTGTTIKQAAYSWSTIP